MKTLIASIVLAFALAAPALADPAKPVTKPVSTAVDDSSTTPSDALIDDATTPQERANLLRRCAGPPPRPIDHTATATEISQPMSEPVAVEKTGAKAG